jgi:hypothetical protein
MKRANLPFGRTTFCKPSSRLEKDVLQLWVHVWRCGPWCASPVSFFYPRHGGRVAVVKRWLPSKQVDFPPSPFYLVPRSPIFPKAAVSDEANKNSFCLVPRTPHTISSLYILWLTSLFDARKRYTSTSKDERVHMCVLGRFPFSTARESKHQNAILHR